MLSHTHPTGYSRHGECVPQDTRGATAYTEWLRRALRQRKAVAGLSEVERAHLDLAAAELAAEAEARPRDGKRRLRRRLLELREALAAIVPRGHPLYPLFWAEQLLCDEYNAAVVAQRAEAKRAEAEARRAARGRCYDSWQEYKAAKHGVEWEADAEAGACRACARPFTVVRRRHHCRACGKLVCDGCSRGRLALRGASVPQRVCDVCAAADPVAAALAGDDAASEGVADMVSKGGASRTSDLGSGGAGSPLPRPEPARATGLRSATPGGSRAPRRRASRLPLAGSPWCRRALLQRRS